MNGTPYFFEEKTGRVMDEYNDRMGILPPGSSEDTVMGWIMGYCYGVDRGEAWGKQEGAESVQGAVLEALGVHGAMREMQADIKAIAEACARSTQGVGLEYIRYRKNDSQESEGHHAGGLEQIPR